MISSKKISSISLPVLALLFSGAIFAQSIKTKKAIKNTSSQPSDTVKTKGTYAAKVYFSGNGLQYVKVGEYFGSDPILLMKRIDSASNGAIVTIDDYRFINSDGKITMLKEIPYSFNKLNGTVKFKSKAVQQADELRSYNFVSGTIYFSGFGHTNISSAKASDTATLNKYYDRSGPGTTITLDKCVYKNVNGTLSTPISKSVKLE